MGRQDANVVSLCEYRKKRKLNLFNRFKRWFKKTLKMLTYEPWSPIGKDQE